jgi:hypothetical protein
MTLVTDVAPPGPLKAALVKGGTELVVVDVTE